MNTIVRRDPFSSLLSLPKWFEDFDLESQRGLKVYETDKDIVAEAVVAGVPARDVEVNIEDGVLTIKAETSEEERNKAEYSFSTSKYYYTAALSGGIWEKATAETRHGVVKITIPKQESARPRRIEVKETEN